MMPLAVGIRFAHAAVQAIADAEGVDVLHVKGPAVAPALLNATVIHEDGQTHRIPIERYSVDADVIVRPDQVDDLMAAMSRHGWSLAVDFADGSAFEHAATMDHPRLGHVDVHRRFPGLGPDPARAFDALWRDHGIQDIAGYPCAVPDPTAQRLVLLLNAVRGGLGSQAEIQRLWHDAHLEEREAVRRLARQIGAEVALAAATGELADYRSHREYDLWRLLSEGDRSPVALWLARVKSQPTLRSAAREAVKLIVPNPRRLALQLGRPPSRREVLTVWGRRILRGVRGLVGGLPRAFRGRRR